MTTYIVAFEVNDDFTKNQLKEKLKQYSGYCPIHDNCWAIVSESNTNSNIRFFRSSCVRIRSNICYPVWDILRLEKCLWS